MRTKHICENCGSPFMGGAIDSFCEECGETPLVKTLLREAIQREGRIANAKLMRERKREDIRSLGLDPDKPEPNESR